jgi:uncharacterized protein YndB with AHSA1/START domain
MKIDVIRHIGAVTRTVTRRDHEGRPANVVQAERTYDTTPEDVWDAMTSAERIPRWFAPVSGDFRLGGRYQIQGNASGTVTACEPPQHLTLTWEFGGAVTWVDVRLSADPHGGTRLVLEHIAHEDPHWEQYGPGAVGVGWELGLLGLALHLETGESVPPEANKEWLITENYKGFARASSEGWCQAAISAGADAVAATAAAARTTAFYTGEGAPPSGETDD